MCSELCNTTSESSDFAQDEITSITSTNSSSTTTTTTTSNSTSTTTNHRTRTNKTDNSQPGSEYFSCTLDHNNTDTDHVIQSAADQLTRETQQLVDQNQLTRQVEQLDLAESSPKKQHPQVTKVQSEKGEGPVQGLKVEEEESGEVPTLRRKEKKAVKGGPRVTRNITDDEVISRLSKLCTHGLPWNKYRKVNIYLCKRFILIPVCIFQRTENRKNALVFKI